MYWPVSVRLTYGEDPTLTVYKVGEAGTGVEGDSRMTGCVGLSLAAMIDPHLK
jgi:hypothetical protein